MNFIRIIRKLALPGKTASAELALSGRSLAQARAAHADQLSKQEQERQTLLGLMEHR